MSLSAMGRLKPNFNKSFSHLCEIIKIIIELELNEFEIGIGNGYLL